MDFCKTKALLPWRFLRKWCITAPRKLVVAVSFVTLVSFTLLIVRGCDYACKPDSLCNQICPLCDKGYDPDSGTRAVNATIVYLANRGRVGELISSLEMLFTNFNNEYKYPILVFYDDRNGTEPFDINGVLKNLTLAPEKKALIRFEYLKFEFPEGFNQANASQVLVWREWFPGYHSMIAFWSYFIFHHPLIRDLEYFWRLDTDAYVTKPVKVDVFKKMERNKYRYGYRLVALDPPHVNLGWISFLNDYIKENDIQMKQPKKLTKYLTSKDANQYIPNFYNNFEILHVPTFRRSDMEAFRLAVMNTYKIYTHRWGDHTQRYAMVNIFLDADEVHEVCECSYVHQSYSMRATC